MQQRTRLTFFATLNRCKLSRQATICLALIGFVQPASAEWSGGVEGGTVLRDAGNANRVRLVLQNNSIPFSQYFYAEWLSTGSDGSNYALGYNPRYWLSQKNYVFGESEFRVDESLGIDREIRLLGGMGRQFISSAHQGLYAELGLGGRSTKRLDADGVQTDEDASTGGVGLARLGYYRTMADTIKVDFKVGGSLSADDISEANSELGVSLRLPQGSVRLAYRSRYLKVGEADAITDGDSFVSFGYSF